MGKKDQDGFKEKKIRRKGEGKRSEKEMKDMVKRKNTLKTKKTIRGEGEITYHEKKEKKFQEEKAEIQSDGDKKSTSIPFK